MENAAPRPIEALLAHYAESHRHPVNEIIHCICIPAIVFSLLGLLWSLQPFVALGVVMLSLAYYFRLSIPFAIGMLLMSGVMLWLLSLVPEAQVWKVSVAVFVIAWIGQFVGHAIEGRKPSFFEDLRYLLIGPLFVLRFLYRRFKIAY